MALHRALSGFLGAAGPPRPLTGTLATISSAKRRSTLRSIKELEFDHAMGKVSEADFAELRTRLRARALDVMEELERAPDAAPVTTPAADEAGSTPIRHRRSHRPPVCVRRADRERRRRAILQAVRRQAWLGGGARSDPRSVVLLRRRAAASAQAPVQMPNPKEMSGIVRPDVRCRSAR